MFRKIQNPGLYEVAGFDGSGAATVYQGGLHHLERTILCWRSDLSHERIMVLNLDEIRNQICGTGEDYKRKIITIFQDGPLSGTILQYGNYGDEWFIIGETAGYA